MVSKSPMFVSELMRRKGRRCQKGDKVAPLNAHKCQEKQHLLQKWETKSLKKLKEFTCPALINPTVTTWGELLRIDEKDKKEYTFISEYGERLNWMAGERPTFALGSINGPFLTDTLLEKAETERVGRVFGQMMSLIAPKKGPRRAIFIKEDGFAIRERILDEVLKDLPEHLYNIERDQKFGPCHYEGYKSLIPTIEKHYSKANPKFDKEVLKRAVTLAIDELLSVRGEISPLSLDDSIQRLRKNTAFQTNSGWPFFKQTVNLSEEELAFHKQMAEMMWRGWAPLNAPCVLFKRVQPGRMKDGEYHSKNRAVMASPKFEHFGGGRFWYPLLDVMKELPQYASYLGNHKLHPVVEEILAHDYQASIDFNNYDTTIGGILPYVLDELKRVCPNAEGYLEWSKKYYLNAPLITPHGILTGVHGLFSGMLGTSFLGSICNRVAMLYSKMRIEQSGYKIVSFTHCTMGDDTIVGITLKEGELHLDLICTFLGELGLSVTNDVDKQMFCTPGTKEEERCIVFLSRYWYYSNPQPIFSVIRCLGNLIYGEDLIFEEKVISRCGLYLEQVCDRSVIGPILLRFVASLTNIEHHPKLSEFLRIVQENIPHHLHPATWLSETELIKAYGAHIDFDLISAHGLGVLRVTQMIVENFETLFSDKVYLRDDYDTSTIEELCKRADENSLEGNNKSEDGDESDKRSLLIEDLLSSGISDRAKEDILRSIHALGIS